MTVRAVAVGDGSAGYGTAQPVGVNTRARARETPRSVTHRDRVADRGPGLVRRVGRVVYLDAADSWPLQERSPSAVTVWNTDYTALLDTVWTPYGYWARAWRVPAVLFAVLFDAAKWLLIHPFRGPATLTVAAYLLTTRLG